MRVEYLLSKLREKLVQKQNSGEKSLSCSMEEIDKIIEEIEMPQKPQSEEELKELLENATKKFFPESGEWGYGCFYKSKDYRMSNLPCNLRDHEWLAKMLQINCGLTYIEFNKILDFVITSPLFRQERYLYEQRIVKWQLEYMISGGEGWLVDKGYGEDFINLDSNCDIGFRKGVVKTLTAIGMDIEAVEEGIEKNALLWRERYMRRAFRNKYNPIFLTIEPTSLEHEENWIKMRLFEYYQEHKNSVDKYGAVTPEMKMTEEEAMVINTYLKSQDEERLAYIDKCKNDPDKQLRFSIDFGI